MMLKKFWNSKWLGWAAVWSSRFFNYFYVLLGGAVFIWGVQGAGFSWTILGLLFAGSGIFSIYSVKKRKYERTHIACPQCTKEVKIGVKFCPNCGAEISVKEVEPDNLEEAGEEDAAYNAETMTKKKIGFLVTAGIVILILLFLIGGKGSLSGPVYEIKHATFEQYGPQTIEEIVDGNFRGANWSSEKIDRTSAHVYVEGYMPFYGENVRIKFYYEDQGDGTFQYQIDEVYFQDSRESFTDVWNIYLFLSMLY